MSITSSIPKRRWAARLPSTSHHHHVVTRLHHEKRVPGRDENLIQKRHLSNGHHVLPTLQLLLFSPRLKSIQSHHCQPSYSLLAQIRSYTTLHHPPYHSQPNANSTKSSHPRHRLFRVNHGPSSRLLRTVLCRLAQHRPITSSSLPPPVGPTDPVLCARKSNASISLLVRGGSSIRSLGCASRSRLSDRRRCRGS